MSMHLLSMARPRGGQTLLVAAFAPAAKRSSLAVLATDFSTSSCSKSTMKTPFTSSTTIMTSATQVSWRRQLSAMVHQHHRHHQVTMMTVNDENYNNGTEDDANNYKTIHSEWNVKGLKEEVNRLIIRSHKKIGKASTRLEKARELVMVNQNQQQQQQQQQQPNGSTPSSATNGSTDQDVKAMQMELEALQSRLRGLNQLLELLSTKVSSSNKGLVVLPTEIAQLAVDLQVNDQPPPKEPREPKKVKGPRSKNPPKTRLPYRRFYSQDNTEIRVGKQAEDNDELSLSPEHRAGSDWWMHASGCPGSHVVIRCSDENMNEDVVQDAAALAARHSKCAGDVIKVSMTRCRNIKKPLGAKAGLVHLSGPVRTVTVNMKEAEKRLQRLDATAMIN